jgi:DNA-binding response OmpR family regulator
MKKVLDMVEHIGNEGVLIVDDDPDFVESIKEMLEAAGKRVFTAPNGQEALKHIQSDGIDILILDLRMPILSGLETYVALKRTGHVVPTIIVTAFAKEEKESLESLRLMSVNGILTKPFNPRDLLETVNRLLQEKRGISL